MMLIFQLHDTNMRNEMSKFFQDTINLKTMLVEYYNDIRFEIFGLKITMPAKLSDVLFISNM